MKTTTKATILISALTLLMLGSTAFALAETVTSTGSTPSPSTVGRGWFIFNGRRHNFALYAKEGTLNEADGWRYLPKGNLALTVLDLKGNRLILVKSLRVWRFRTNKIDAGSRTVIEGVANVGTRMGVLEKCWIRAEARDLSVAENGVDGFIISIWRPGGADKQGCWTPRTFDPQRPRTLSRNPTPFYTALGRLRGGAIEIVP